MSNEGGDVLVLNADMQPINYIPISTTDWVSAIKLKCKDAVEIVHEYENWVVRSPSVTMKLPSVIMMKKYVKPDIKVKYSDENVALRDDYTCQYCYGQFATRDLEMEHVLPKSKGGHRGWTNIVASCGPCNRKKGNNEKIVPKVAPVRPEYYTLVGKARKYKITVPDEQWIPYLGWDESLVTVKRPKFDMADLYRILSEDDNEDGIISGSRHGRKSA